MKQLYVHLPKFLRAYVSFDLRRKTEGIVDVEVDGIDTRDYPDFCDAFIASAYWGITFDPLTEAELETLGQDYDFLYERIIDRIY